MQYIVSTVIGLSFVVGLLIWVVFTQKKLEKDGQKVTFGELMNTLFLRQRLSIFVITLFLVNLSEALWAASITPKGEEEISFIARILGHSSISLVAITCGIWAPAGWKKVLLIKEGRGSLIFVTLVYTICAFLLPYINVMLIAGGLKETANFAELIYGDFQAGWESMSYGMQATIGMWWAHYILLIIDSVSILLNLEGNQSAINQGISSSLHEKITKKGEEEKKRKEESSKKEEDSLYPKDYILYMLKRYGFPNKEELEAKVDACNKILDKLGSKEQAALSTHMDKLYKFIISKDKEKKDKYGDNEAKRKEINKEISEKIYDLFAKTTKGGEGFGMTLPKKNTSKN